MRTRILTPRALTIAEDLMQDPKVGSVFFGFTTRLIRGIRRRIHEEYTNFSKRNLLDRFSPYRKEFATGVYYLRKSLAKLRDVPAEYDDLHRQIRAKGGVCTPRGNHSPPYWFVRRNFLRCRE